MKKIKINLCLVLLILVVSCKTNNLRYTFIPNDKKSENIKENKTLLLYLYNEKDIAKDINIINEKREEIYSNKGVLGDKSKFLALKIPVGTKYVLVNYNKKRNKIEIKHDYNYLYLEFKGEDFIEIVYSNEKPEFID
ncbi:hypothetical protein [Chryseobacterium indologenes]|uniref:hypothetical protein n=1 Tax=Chryseobacterium indologenes TaxID=253 RepID=UPI000B51D695|nr:hypothetical protein [Chryseobacterium indologenes]ASE62181.1 hypothetical protein CEQ15_12095 [Chryseobacterium indologenes]VFA41665.1 Uncharacterised protein [Chryseobacterium indologenes]